MRRVLSIAIMSGLAALPRAAFAQADTHLITLTRNDVVTQTFAPFADTLPGTIGSIASGDLGGDGVAEILVGAGAGMQPLVTVFRQDGSMIGSFLAYDAAFMRGVNVTVCDVNGDRMAEIVTGAKFGGGPHVRIFDAMGTPIGGFFAYAEDFRGGVNVACDDVTGDGVDDIVTGAGLSGGPHIKMFTMHGDMYAEVFSGSATANTGAYVTVDNGTVLAASMGDAESPVSTFAWEQGALVPQTTVTDVTQEHLYTVAAVNDDTTAIADITTDLFHDTSPRYILVDISEQRLTAYAYGVEVHSFLISSGLYGYDTPYGKTTVTAKLPVHNYGGADYWYPNVKWNLRFRPHYYIHTAYWHNNFGYRMSHGCINAREVDAAWIYAWADVGTPVEIVP